MRVNINGEWLNSGALDTLAVHDIGTAESTAIHLLREWIRGQEVFTFQTSGSTGSPSTIFFHRRQLEASAKLSIDALGLQPGMTSLVCLDARYVAGAMMVIRSAVAGMDLVISKPSSNPFADLQVQVNFAAIVPMQLMEALRECPERLARTSIVIVGGAPLPESAVPQLSGFPTRFYATYGMTETLTHIALRPLNGPGQKSNFHLLPGISAASDERGCIVINAPHLGPEPIVTNDLVEWEEDGGFRLAGRHDEVINSGGVKVQPGRVELAVEQAIKQLGLHCKFFVAGWPDERLNEVVILVLEGSTLPSEVEQELSEILAARLGRYEVPRHIMYAPRFQETETQKIDKRGTLKLVERKTP